MLLPRRFARNLLLLLCPALSLGGDAADRLYSTRLRPDGMEHAARHDRPVRFSFWPQGEQFGLTMQKFRLWVQQGEQVVVQEEIVSTSPTLTMRLGPGSYRWFVRWWNVNGTASEVAEAGLVVEQADNPCWKDVPWLGNNNTNEFRAGINFGNVTAGAVELRVATLGFGYVTVNNQEVSKDRLSYSGWTVTEKRILYRTYDITALLNSSRGGTLFVGLGCGYRCDPRGRFPRYRDGFDMSNDTVPKIFRMQVLVAGQLMFHSGSPGWEMRQGPVVEDSVYDGETWIASAAEEWVTAPPLPPGLGPKGKMLPATFPGVQVTRVDGPVSITNPAEGVYVVDFGSNVAGVCSLSVPGPATISMKHGELMQHEKLPTLKTPDPKRVYFGNLRSAQQNDTLVTASAIADWSPRFTYHGFRYVEVYGFPGNLTPQNIRRLRLNSAVEDRVHLQFGDEVLQAIHEGSKGTQRSNLMQVPTDCPQRDERLGWMGDNTLSSQSMLAHFDYANMAVDWLDTIVDELDEQGSLPDVVPWQRFGGRPGDPSWTGAFLELLWALSVQGGDLDLAKAHWEHVKAHLLGSLRQQYEAAHTLRNIPERYGDWCVPPSAPGGDKKELASKGFAAAFSMARSVRQAAEIGKKLGESVAADTNVFTEWAANMSKEFHDTFYDEKLHQYDTGTLLSFVLPLALGAVPDSEKGAVMENLVAHIHENKNASTGGIITNRHVFDVLHDNGEKDLALDILQQKEYPSYGYMYFNEYEPARECMWELPDAPYQGDGMNSRNHHMYSSVGLYLIRISGVVLGPKDHEFTATVMHPRAPRPTSLTSREDLLRGGIATSIHTPQGLANFSWQWEQKSFDSLRVKLLVPVSARAHLQVPAHVHLVEKSGGGITAAASHAEAMANVVLDGERLTRLTLPSGRYDLFSTSPGETIIM